MNIHIFVGNENPDVLRTIEKLRKEAWTAELDNSKDLVDRFNIHQADLNATHICLEFDGKITACGRITYHQDFSSIQDCDAFTPVKNQMAFPLAHFSRLAVLPESRNNNQARQIDQKRIELAGQTGMKQAWLEAQGNRIKALEALGFCAVAPSADRAIPGEWWLLRYSFNTANP